MNSNPVGLVKQRENLTMLLQLVPNGGEEAYLVYLAPHGEVKGKFRQEEVGVVWVSDNFPDGQACQTLLVAKKTGEAAMEFLKAQMAEMHGNPRERK